MRISDPPRLEKSHLDLIARIYDLPLRPENWQSVLDDFVPIMSAAGANLTAIDSQRSEYQISIVTSFYTAQGRQADLDYFNRHLNHLDRPAYEKLARMNRREFFSDMDLQGLSETEQKMHPPVRWLEERFGVRHRAAASLNTHRAWQDALAVQFPNTRGPITDGEKALGGFFLDHFAKAVELGRSFTVLQSRFQGTLSALDRFHIGVCVLSPNGAVVVKNREATRILDARDGLGLSRESRLAADGAEDRAALEDAVVRAVSTARAENNQAETVLALPRRSGEVSYLVEIAPIRDEGEIERGFRGALVFLIDPAKTDIVSTEGMQALFGLTGAESEVCRLIAEGAETAAVAETLNVTDHTVRSHIKKILEKTATNNRAQLVRLALHVNLPIDPADKG